MNKKLSAMLIGSALACCSVAFAQTSGTSSGSTSGQSTQSAQGSSSQDTSGTSGSSRSTGTTGSRSGTSGMSGSTGTIDDQSGMSTSGTTTGSSSTNLASNGSQSFDSLDTKHQGYLKQSDLASNRQLSARFGTCDKNHDGRLTRDEYNTCVGSTSNTQY